MRKHIFTSLSIVALTVLSMVGVFTAGSASASLWNYYQEQGLTLPSIEERADEYVAIADDVYVGSYTQNEALEQYFRAAFDVPPSIGATLLVAGSTYTLAGSGITSSATSITLQSLTIPQTGKKLVDADFSDTFYITLEPGSRKRQEIASCTTVVQNAGDTATLSGCSRGLAPFTPFTASTTYAFSHGGGTQVIFSDPPQVFNEFTAKTNAETIERVWTFGVYPEVDPAIGSATTSNQFATLSQLNAGFNSGAATSSDTVAGISERATAIEMASSTVFDANNPHYISSELATSSPYTHTGAGGNNAVITEADLYIDQGFIDLSEDFFFSSASNTFSGGVKFTGNVTTTAATSTSFFSQTVSTTNFYIDSIYANPLVTGSTTEADHLHTHVSTTQNVRDNNWFSYTVPTIAGLMDTNAGTPAFGSSVVTLTGTNDEGIKVDIAGEGSDAISQFDGGKDVYTQARMKVVTGPASGDGFGYGLTTTNQPVTRISDQNNQVIFFITDSGSGDELYAKTAAGAAADTAVQITGITLGNFNTYRIEYDIGVEARFYVNGVLETIIKTNLPTGANLMQVSVGVDDSANSLIASYIQIMKEI